MKLSRRVFLGTALGGGAAALAVGAGMLAPLPPGEGLLAFSTREFTTLQAITDALFPRDVLGVGPVDVGVAQKTDAYAANMFPRERMLLKLMMRLLEKRPHLEGLGGFSTLPVDQRVTLLRRWEDEGGLFGLGVSGVRVLCAMFFFGDAKVQAAVGWGMGCDDVRPRPEGVPG
ncbi:MAG: hypothetical protein AB2A00_24300 [Myxococcota bacterium]